MIRAVNMVCTGRRCAAIACAAMIFNLVVSTQAQTAGNPSAGTAAAPQNAATQTTSAAQRYAAYQKKTEERMMNDWAFLGRFRDADAALPPPAPGENRVVFMGDSITEIWTSNGVVPPPPGSQFFPGKPYINRGISGQTTPQMLVRFRQDVINLQPSVVVILAGTNDIAGNTGPTTLSAIENNLKSMSDLAHANGIRVVLCSVLPAAAYAWKPEIHPAAEIVALNTWMKSYAARKGDVYVDYYSAMADSAGGLPPALSRDGVHPNQAGFAIMDPLVEMGIAQALKKTVQP